MIKENFENISLSIKKIKIHSFLRSKKVVVLLAFYFH